METFQKILVPACMRADIVRSDLTFGAFRCAVAYGPMSFGVSFFSVQAQVSLPAILSGGAAEAYQQGDKGDLRGEIRNLLEKQQGTPAAAGSASNEDESSVIRR
jgi:hypothetical protein